MAKRGLYISEQAEQTSAHSVSLQPDENASSRSRLQALLNQQPLFHGMNTRQLALLAGLAMVIQFEPSEYIFKQGDPANRFYLLLEGEVVLELNSKIGERTLIRVAGPGMNIGWSWLFEPFYFAASARVTQPTKAIFFYGTMLRQHCEDDHEFGYEIMRRIVTTVVRSITAFQESFLRPSRTKSLGIGVVPEEQTMPTESLT